MNRKELIIRVSLTATILVVIAALLPACQHKISQDTNAAPSLPKQTVEESKPSEYKVGQVIRNSTEPYDVTVFISTNPKHFVRDEMIRLARQLNSDFSKEQILVVEILDDDYTASNYLPVANEYTIFNKARRGLYRLNRIKGEEYIEFSTERGKPLNEVRIKLH
jgi:hypothetical protein